MKTKEIMWCIITIVIILIAIAGPITAMIFQIMLSIERYGVIFGQDTIIIPHWSLWLNLTTLLFIPLVIWLRN